MRAEIANTATAIEKSLTLLKQRLDWETAEHRLEEFNAMIENPNLWDDQERAQKLMRDRQILVDAMATVNGIAQELADNLELIELGEMEDDADAVRCLRRTSWRSEIIRTYSRAWQRRIGRSSRTSPERESPSR